MVWEDHISHEIELIFGFRGGDGIAEEGNIVSRGKKASAVVGDTGEKGRETGGIIAAVIGHELFYYGFNIFGGSTLPPYRSNL